VKSKIFNHFRFWTIVYFGLFSNLLIGQDQNIPSLGVGLFGHNGQLITPSAYLPEDRTFRVGYGHLSKDAAFTLLSQQKGVGDGIAYVTLGFLPFMELNVRLTRPYGDNTDNTELGIGDRSYAARFQLLKETEKLPAIAVGFHDLFNLSSYFNTSYIVASKSFSFSELKFTGHLGYGHIFQEPFGSYLKGVFGAATVQWKYLEGMIEYDAENINVGIRGNILDQIQINIGLMNFQSLIAGVSWQIKI